MFAAILIAIAAVLASSMGFEEIKPFQEKAYAASSQYDLEFTGRTISAVTLRFAATLTGSAATIRDDAAFRVLKTPEIVQDEKSLMRLRAVTLRHLSAILANGYQKHTASATAARASATINFDALVPGSMINAVTKKVSVRGEFSPLADYSGTAPTAISGKLRPFARSSERDPTRGFPRPDFKEATVLIESSSDDIPFTIRFEQDTILPGLLLIAESATPARTDGLVKKVRVDEFTKAEGTQERVRLTWGQLRNMLEERAKYTPDDLDASVGVVLIPLIDRRNPQWNYARFYRAGESLTLHLDSQTASLEEEYTDTVPAAGCKLYVSILGFTMVDGTGDAAAQVTDLGKRASSAIAAPTTARDRRRARRAARV